MIVLDTNVISELMKAEPETKVITWADRQDPQALVTTAITAAELYAGFEQMPGGKNSDKLERTLNIMLEQRFRGRILPFDESCAPVFAKILARRRAMGRRIEEPDAMIAAICSNHHFKIATRDTGGFSHCGIEVINPWTD